jgi:hypothetical protein
LRLQRNITGRDKRDNNSFISLFLHILYKFLSLARHLQSRTGATNRQEAMTMKIAEKFERVMMAAAFAEENEHSAARELLTERRETERTAKRPAIRTQPRQTLRAD